MVKEEKPAFLLTPVAAVLEAKDWGAKHLGQKRKQETVATPGLSGAIYSSSNNSVAPGFPSFMRNDQLVHTKPNSGSSARSNCDTDEKSSKHGDDRDLNDVEPENQHEDQQTDGDTGEAKEPEDVSSNRSRSRSSNYKSQQSAATGGGKRKRCRGS
jgi:hypothetical protein